MSNEPQIKKFKKHHDFKKNFHNQNTNRKFIEPGQRGFLATCNFRERACVRECYNILNDYADELYGPVKNTSKNSSNSTVNTDQQTQNKQNEPTSPVKEVDNSNDDNDDDEEDITDALEKEIQNTKAEKKINKYRFQVVDTGASNCMFIKTTLSDPIELGYKIVKDIAETKKQKSRHLLRLVPINTVTRANLKDIIDAAGKLFDQYFLDNPKTFSIIFNKRYNNDVKRDEIIQELAELVTSKNIKNKVDLKNAEISVIVEIIKGLCCIGIIPHYLKYKKYNLVELAAKDLTTNEDINVKKDSTENKEEGSCSKLDVQVESPK